MKVIVNQPVPVAAPPPTYDIIGLTAEEAAILRDILNCGPGRAKPGTALENLLATREKHNVWACLSDALDR